LEKFGRAGNSSWLRDYKSGNIQALNVSGHGYRTIKAPISKAGNASGGDPKKIGVRVFTQPMGQKWI